MESTSTERFHTQLNGNIPRKQESGYLFATIGPAYLKRTFSGTRDEYQNQSYPGRLCTITGTKSVQQG